MYTRASSIRSNYTTSTSSKAKFMLPQRIVGGNGSIQHYNALHATDTTVLKNNNIVNAQCGTNNNNNWNTKSAWLLNQTAANGNSNGSSMVEWRDDRKHCGICLPKVCYKNANATNGTAIITTNGKHSKNFLYDIAKTDVNEAEKTCCCQPLSNNIHQLNGQPPRIDNDVRRISNMEMEQMQTRGKISPLLEDDDSDVSTGKIPNEDAFHKSIVLLNILYNNSNSDDSDEVLNGDECNAKDNVYPDAATMPTKLANDIIL